MKRQKGLSRRSPDCSTCATGWNSRVTFAELDFATDGSPTLPKVTISSTGISNAPDAIRLQITILYGPNGIDADAEMDLRAEDFRPLLAVLERAIVEAEKSGILTSRKLPPKAKSA